MILLELEGPEFDESFGLSDALFMVGMGDVGFEVFDSLGFVIEFVIASCHGQMGVVEGWLVLEDGEAIIEGLLVVTLTVVNNGAVDTCFGVSGGEFQGASPRRGKRSLTFYG